MRRRIGRAKDDRERSNLGISSVEMIAEELIWSSAGTVTEEGLSRYEVTCHFEAVIYWDFP